jgi:hypothetical protein
MTTIFVSTRMRRGDEVPDVAAFRSLDSEKRSVGTEWPEKIPEQPGKHSGMMKIGAVRGVA